MNLSDLTTTPRTDAAEIEIHHSKPRFRLSMAMSYARTLERECIPSWRPIETAPKVGAFITALKTDDGYEFGIANLTTNGAVQSVDDCEPYFCREYYCEATHWMPLPLPPNPA